MTSSQHALCRGFTLIELMLVISLIAIVLTSSLPSFSALIDRQRLRAAGADVHAALLLARGEALRRDTTVAVSFAPATSLAPWCYGMNDAGPCDCRTSSNCVNTGMPARIRQGGDFPGVALTTNFTPQQTAVFHPARGTATPGTVRLSNNAGNLHIVVSSLGRIRICSPEGRDFPAC
ncbi:MAG: GspH/FimT family pseudopilin [Chromatiales bacterium]|nr:GspH/FimT family pseudopilin [Chromatiales bacterium]